MDKGYEVSEAQAIKIISNSDKFTDPAIKEHITSAFNILLKNELLNALQIQLNYEDFHINDSLFYYNRKDYQSVTQEQVQILAKKINLIFDYINFNPNNETDEEALKLFNACKNIKHVINSFENFSFNEKDKFLLKINSYIDEIEKNREHIVTDDFIKKINEFSPAFSDFEHIKNNITKDIIKNMTNFNEKYLPSECIEVIKQIKQNHLEINIDKLQLEQKLELNNLYNKKLPQVLEEYITISPRYREKLKSHDENPDKLLLESLIEINKGVSEISNSLQENNFTQLKISNKYLKNKSL